MSPQEVSRRSVLKAAGLLTATAAAGSISPWDLPRARAAGLPAEDGYDLWLRYHQVGDAARLAEYRARCGAIVVQEDSTRVLSACDEARRALSGLLGEDVAVTSRPTGPAVVLGTWAGSSLLRQLVQRGDVERVGPEGFLLRSVPSGGRDYLVVGSTTGVGVLYGIFALLRVLQRQQSVAGLDVYDKPTTQLRLANHWDNLDGSVERGYAGRSIFHWGDLPSLDPRYTDYARTLASIGMNGAVVNNVNANPQFLTDSLIGKLAALAGALRPWGVQLYLSANFAAPLALGELKTADPLDPAVAAWWRAKADDIYNAIPDFGGFLVKANSEGQPGPIDYGGTHADGANMMARALAPHDGVVMWRTFVYDYSSDVARYAYDTFTPLDGQFDDNVVLQAKYGPVDFHIREPVHPLFGAMPHSNMMIELQITQEHTGHATDLNYLPVWWRQVLDFDTYARGPGSTVARVVDGSLFGNSHYGSAGVMNFGDERNWTGSHLAAANTHGYGRLLWNPAQRPEALAREWIEMTFGIDPDVVAPLEAALLSSWLTFENYTSPLGVGNMVASDGDHYDPDPVASQPAHRSDAEGTGYDRTVATGDGFTALYHQPWARIYESLSTMPDELILFMHHVPYGHKLQSGPTVIDHIYESHFAGLETVHGYQQMWQGMSGHVDPQRFAEVAATFDKHVAHATLWRDTIVSYFFSLSRILGSTRSWVQLHLDPSDTLLLGGWPTRVRAQAGNASPQTLTVRARLDASGDWQTRTSSTRVLSDQFAELTATAVPPAAGMNTTGNVAVDAAGLPVLGATSIDFVTTPAPKLCFLALDGGTPTSPLFPGYQRLSPDSAWSPDLGFGWVGTPPQSRDRGTPDDLRRDFCNAPVPATLRVQVPAGAHPAYLLVGDAAVGSAPTIVSSDGTELARSDQLPGNGFQWLHFTLDGGSNSRAVDLRLTSVSGQHWHCAAFALVDETATLPSVVVGEAPASILMLPGEPTTARFWLYNSTMSDVAVTPKVSVPDGYTAPTDGGPVTVPGSGDVEVTITVVRQPGATAGTLEFTIPTDSAKVPLAPSDNWMLIASLTASSTHAPSSVANLQDGNTDSSVWGGGGAGGWNDDTPGVFPDTVTATWTHPVDISRVRVYTLDSTSYPASQYGVRDYDLLAHVSGSWQTVAQVRNNQNGMVESTFPQVSADQLQVKILASNSNDYSRLVEVEAYTK